MTTKQKVNWGIMFTVLISFTIVTIQNFIGDHKAKAAYAYELGEKREKVIQFNSYLFCMSRPRHFFEDRKPFFRMNINDLTDEEIQNIINTEGENMFCRVFKGKKKVLVFPVLHIS